MKLDLSKTPTEGVWMDFDEDVSFKLRYVSPEILRKTKTPHIKKTHFRGQPQEQVNTDAWDADVVHFMIEEWKGIMDGNGLAECSKENKMKLMRLSAKHSMFVYENATDLSNFVTKDQEAELKNSESSSGLG